MPYGILSPMRWRHTFNIRCGSPSGAQSPCDNYRVPYLQSANVLKAHVVTTVPAMCSKPTCRMVYRTPISSSRNPPKLTLETPTDRDRAPLQLPSSALDSAQAQPPRPQPPQRTLAQPTICNHIHICPQICPHTRGDAPAPATEHRMTTVRAPVGDPPYYVVGGDPPYYVTIPRSTAHCGVRGVMRGVFSTGVFTPGVFTPGVFTRGVLF